MMPNSKTKFPFIWSVSIIGLGKLGTPMLAAFASEGFYVIGVDVDKTKMEAIRNRTSPVQEPGVNELLRDPINAYYTSVTGNVRLAVMDSDATFIVTATPSKPDGTFSLEYVLNACREIGAALKDKPSFHIVVLTSTVCPGGTDEARKVLEEASGKKCGVDFGLCYNPEFIALGSVLKDFKNPDVVLIGESDPTSGEALELVYMKICGRKPIRYHRMNFVNAEITKLAINTFITTKIAYANMLGSICQNFPGGDVDVVTEAVGSDTRIGNKYLRAGANYGGPCFPRDNEALASVAESVKVYSGIPRTTDCANNSHVREIASLIRKLKPSSVGILGTTYKPGTDVTEESLWERLSSELAGSFPVLAIRANEQAGFLADCPVIVIATLNPEFETIPDTFWVGKTVIDPWRAYKRLDKLADVRYIGLGLGSTND